MKIEEHQAILAELNSDKIEPSRKMELITKLTDDYTVTQAELTTTKDTLTSTEKEKNHFAQLSQKLWLENSATLTDVKTKETTQKEKEIEHQAKRTFESLASKF